MGAVAFPLISAGIYGWPQDDAIAVAIEAIRSFSGNVEEARLVAFDAETYARDADQIGG